MPQPMQNLTPKAIVEELDRHIIGQAAAKRAVAVAIRNRWRRQRLDPELARDVSPKNIIMIGPTGVGKTEIARRLANLTGAPFIKVEASKFTEVGYHGRDVESMIRDLLEQAIGLVRSESAQAVTDRAQESVLNRVVDLLLPTTASDVTVETSSGEEVTAGSDAYRRSKVRERLREQVAAGKLDEREVELTVTRRPGATAMFANMGLDQMDPEMANMLERMIPEQHKRRRVTVAEARRILLEEETDKLLDAEKITAEAISRTQDTGIVFLDEIDKVASTASRGGAGASGGGSGGGPDVSRQGVQRDLLPIVEGSAVTTRHGVVHTDHILFIAAGAFHSASVSDLMPELQGRFPIRVELSPLGREEFIRILREPRSALIKQQQALLGVEGLDVVFEDAAIEAIADLAARANASIENIGARRLMTIVEKVFEQINFDAPEMASRGEKRVSITEAFVREQVAAIVEDADLSRFVL
jgi:ATP-dependent HslUV protease ATP-binding subunit HslU